ncbi:MAG TPA: O-methyltransferase [Kofleriaceae bacterium]|jgi:caffeoyl-CoA O-methyltransferase|nr:O-methyltransferase [Kofleriaceae bacterium]
MADSASRASGRLLPPEVIDYVNRVHVPHDAGLARAYEVPEGIPAIQVGPSDGRLLALLLRLIQAKRVVEVGTLVGYSAIHMARALAPGGHLWSVEYEPRHAEVARANFAAAGVADRVTVHVGAGRDVLPTLEAHGPFDAVFIDADKDSYAHYGQWAIDHLRPGGLVLGDNSYLFGELLEDNARGRAMRAFHELVAQHCDSVCAPTPEGLVVGIKR